ncbi:MAG: molybdopterin converting factor subunit 1 [Candidatus Promineifilaceae bacterium]|nr:molybdopterin converting factor subunit 1 [Candidatus Promineifilaceae bacterium]
MELEVRLFATLKDRAGRDRVTVTVSEPATVATMRDALAETYPALASSIPVALVAVNQDFAPPETPLEPEDEIALFPPVSGGGGDGERFPYPTYFAITAERLDVEAVTARLAEPAVGAIVFFQGTVRGETEREGLPSQTLYLEYEAYEQMAHQKMAQIAHEIWEQWPQVRGVAIVQRVGKLDVGETTTFVACAAGHRDQGVFEAARYGIDRLKEIVPVWKKEVGEDQSVWVEGDYRPSEADRTPGALAEGE